MIIKTPALIGNPWIFVVDCYFSKTLLSAEIDAGENLDACAFDDTDTFWADADLQEEMKFTGLFDGPANGTPFGMALDVNSFTTRSGNGDEFEGGAVFNGCFVEPAGGSFGCSGVGYNGWTAGLAYVVETGAQKSGFSLRFQVQARFRGHTEATLQLPTPTQLIFFDPTAPINEAVYVKSESSHRSVLVGQPFELFAIGEGLHPITYQWKKNGANIGGATSAFYSVAAAVVGDAGEYTCRLTNSRGETVDSSEMTVTVS